MFVSAAGEIESQRQSPSATAGGGTPPRKTVAIVAAYLLAYVWLDWVSYIHPVAPYAITVWNPPPGVSLALLFAFGLRYCPALFVASALAEVIVRHAGASIWETAAYAAILAAGYTGIAAFLLKPKRFDPSFNSLRDLVIFITAVGAGAMLVAACYVAAHVLAGRFSWGEFPGHVLHFWVGDVIGIAITTPFVMVHGAKLVNARGLKISGEAALQALSIAATLTIIFGFEAENASKLFYLLFLPLVWISTRYGFEGATAGLLATQVGLIIALQTAEYTTQSVIEFQLLMLALTITGAFLGMASTQWRRARQSLEGREAELKTIFGTAPDAILSVDQSGRILDVNQAGLAMFRATGGELNGMSLGQLIPDLPMDVTAARALEARAMRSDGTDFPVEVSFGSALVGQRRLYIGVVRDMSERKEMEEKLRERERDLDRSLRAAAAAEMASALAHELNQPLTAASNYVQALELLLRRDSADQRQVSDTMNKAGREVERAGQIVRRLREFYRRSAAKVEPVPVSDLVEAALGPLSQRLQRHRIKLSTDVPADLPLALIDRVQIEMVLHNLLNNAIDSIAEAQPEERYVTVRASADDSGFIAIGVEDTGPGVKPSIAQQLFTTFASSKSAGMGLGLAISRSIVERHGGRLWLDKSGPGARFVLTLPIAAQEGQRVAS